MRILIIGFVVFVIWSFFSVWLYVDKIRPAMNEPVAVQADPEIQTIVADSLVQPEVIMPKEMMIYFEFDKAEFEPDPQTDNSVTEFKTWLDKNPESMLSITGHTDHIGTEKYNQALGLRRAQTVYKYLESKDVAVNKMITDSKGEDQPAADQTTEEGRAKNRRTVITIKK